MTTNSNNIISIYKAIRRGNCDGWSDANFDAYCEELREALAAEFPGVEIEVDELGDSGCTPPVTVMVRDDDGDESPDDRMVDLVDAVAERVLNNGQWTHAE